MFARDRRTVEAAGALVGDEPYMEQQTMFLKQPRAAGAIAPHQDFGCAPPPPRPAPPRRARRPTPRPEPRA
eukprot:SAG11_NODE_7786_length_1096_cov_2.420261_1_plen_70_part_10